MALRANLIFPVDSPLLREHGVETLTGELSLQYELQSLSFVTARSTPSRIDGDPDDWSNTVVWEDVTLRVGAPVAREVEFLALGDGEVAGSVGASFRHVPAVGTPELYVDHDWLIVRAGDQAHPPFVYGDELPPYGPYEDNRCATPPVQEGP